MLLLLADLNGRYRKMNPEQNNNDNDEMTTTRTTVMKTTTTTKTTDNMINTKKDSDNYNYHTNLNNETVVKYVVAIQNENK